MNFDKLKRGMPYKKQAVFYTMKVKELLKILDKDAVNEIVVYDEKGIIRTLLQEEICDVIKKGELYNPVSMYI